MFFMARHTMPIFPGLWGSTSTIEILSLQFIIILRGFYQDLPAVAGDMSSAFDHAGVRGGNETSDFQGVAPPRLS
jgi:hypothetical protein